MKKLDEIWDEYIEKKCLSQKTKNDLIWHIKNDAPPDDAITLATDMGLKELGNVIAKHLEHTDDYTRELTIGCLLGRLKLPEYAEVGLKMAQDEDSGAKNLAIFTLGDVINHLENKFQNKIAIYLLKVLLDEKEGIVERGSAYFSILKSLEIPRENRPPASRNIDMKKDIDWNFIKKFKEKYGLSLP